MEEKQRKQLVTDRRHATALIQAHNRGEIPKQFNTSRLEYFEYFLFNIYLILFYSADINDIFFIIPTHYGIILI